MGAITDDVVRALARSAGIALGLLVGCGPAPNALPDAGLADAALARDGGRDIVVVTMNTGTAPELRHDELPDDGYTSTMAAWSDEHYGNGLAWVPAIEATRAFFARERPDLVAFQEIFHPEACPDVPLEARAGFVCEAWSPGDATVAQTVLGEGYQVACNQGHPDKCLGVRRGFGTIRGCAADLCLEGLEGAVIEGCGRGSRIGRAVIDREGGTPITVVTVHGSSGISPEDEACRVAQLERVFEDLGAGRPAVDGEIDLVLGDFNTDPARLSPGDESAQYLLDLVASGRFHFVNEIGRRATPTYGVFGNIDHVLSDVLTGSCWAAGLDGHPPVTDATYFDHRPIVCSVSAP